MIIETAAIVALAVGVALLERRRLRRQPQPPRRRYTAAVLYTSAGDPRWGVVGSWDRRHHQRLAKRRLKALARRGAR